MKNIGDFFLFSSIGKIFLVTTVFLEKGFLTTTKSLFFLLREKKLCEICFDEFIFGHNCHYSQMSLLYSSY